MNVRWEFATDCLLNTNLTCECVHDVELGGGWEAGHQQHQQHGGQGGREDGGEQLHARARHLGDDQPAADVGEHRARQVEHAPRVQAQDVVGRGQHPDEEEHHGRQGGHQRPHCLRERSVLTSSLKFHRII